MPDIIKLSLRQREQLGRDLDDISERVSDAYLQIYEHLQGYIDALILAIDKLDNPTKAQIKALPQYKALLKQSEKELDRFTQFLEVTMGTAATAAIVLGLADSLGLLKAMGVGKFTGLEPRAMKYLLEYLKEDGVLWNRLGELTTTTISEVVSAIIEGVSTGGNPRVTARLLEDAYGMGLTDALRMMRTVQLYSYRQSAMANYIASDVVEGWIWFAELDELVCMSCVAEHGTIHPLSEDLNDHHNGRCAPLPYISEFGNPVTQTGQDWFNELPEEQQKKMMGPQFWNAWKGGAFTLDQMVKEYENDVYGSMKSVTPLYELLGAEPPLRKTGA